MADARDLREAAARVVGQDGGLLDDRRWDEWLDLYTPDCTFWVPMWRDEDSLNDDPAGTLAHVYYENRKGIEDRVMRVRSGKSPASRPLPRTAHLASYVDVEVLDGQDRMKARASWACHVLFTRARHQHVFFGRSEYALVSAPGGWKIKAKKVVLHNDDIPGVLDFYCV